MTKVVPHPKIDEYRTRIGEHFQQYGGNGGGNGMWQESVENRLADLSTRLENLGREMRTNFLWTWAGLAVMFVILAGLSIQGYLLLDTRMQSLNKSVNDLVLIVSVLRHLTAGLDKSPVSRVLATLLDPPTEQFAFFRREFFFGTLGRHRIFRIVNANQYFTILWSLGIDRSIASSVARCTRVRIKPELVFIFDRRAMTNEALVRDDGYDLASKIDGR